jgi:hypothetical protein
MPRRNGFDQSRADYPGAHLDQELRSGAGQIGEESIGVKTAIGQHHATVISRTTG